MKRPIFTGPGSLNSLKRQNVKPTSSVSACRQEKAEEMFHEEAEQVKYEEAEEMYHEEAEQVKYEEAEEMFHEEAEQVKYEEAEEMFHEEAEEVKHEEAEEMFHEEAGEVKHEEGEEMFHEEAGEVKHEEAPVKVEFALEDTQSTQLPSQEPAVVRPIEDTLENVLEGIKTGKLAALADTMEEEVGFKDSLWESMAPRNAVQAFLGRYTHARKPEYHFEYVTDDNINYLVELVTPAFFGRHYGGYVPAEKHSAETNACLAFKHDPEVDRARRMLLPPLQKIRQHCMLSKAQKEELRKRGFNPEVVQNDIYMLVYSGFRPLGCCTAFWDGNVSEPPMIGKKPE